jgi:rSAM/selenodomain-associated transferase 1
MNMVQRFSSVAQLTCLCVLAWLINEESELILPVFVLTAGLLYAAVLHTPGNTTPRLLVPCIIASGILLRIVFAQTPIVSGFTLTKDMSPITGAAINLLTPQGHPLDTRHLRLLAGCVAAVDCITLMLLASLLRHWRKPAVFLALYAWNPFVLVFGISAIRTEMCAVLLLAVALLCIERSSRSNALAYLFFGGAIVFCPLLVVLYPFLGRGTRLMERACSILVPTACWSLLQSHIKHLLDLMFSQEVIPGIVPVFFVTCFEDWFSYDGHLVIAAIGTIAVWAWIYLWIWLLKQDTPGESLGMVWILLLACVPQFHMWMALPLMLLMLHTPTLARLLFVATCGIAYWSELIEDAELATLAVIWFPVGVLALIELRRRIPFGAPKYEPIESIDIVIPTLNEGSNIGAHLESLQTAIDTTHNYLGDAAPSITVTVLDGGSTDGTAAVVSQFDVQFIRSPGGGRGPQLADGIDEGNGDVVLMLHADSIVRGGALVAMLESFREHAELQWGVLGHSYHGGLPSRRLTRFSNDMRFLYGGIAFGDQGIFARRNCLEAVGGMPRLPLMEDMELSLRLNRCPARLKVGDNLELSTRAWERNRKGSYLLNVLYAGTRYLFHRRCGTAIDSTARRMYAGYYRKPAPEPTAPVQPPIICLYAKPPIPGKTKSRLAADIGDEAAASLARGMLVDNCRLLSQVPGAELQLWHPPDCTPADFDDLIPDAFSFHIQQGADLGERMRSTFEMQLKAGRPVIILGSDCVTHLPAILEAATVALASHDVVLRPAEDGGYVLVGQSMFTPAIFDDINWGSDTVYAETCAKLEGAGCDWTALDKTFDVDLVSDIKLVRDAVTSESHPAVHEWLAKSSATFQADE